MEALPSVSRCRKSQMAQGWMWRLGGFHSIGHTTTTVLVFPQLRTSRRGQSPGQVRGLPNSSWKTERSIERVPNQIKRARELEGGRHRRSSP
jgi:hypothetical protein